MNSLAVLALENGSLLFGTSIGVCNDVGGEVIFNTSMTGYQEILTDPSYAKQIVALTYPHIGNTGMNSLDAESSSSYACALIIKDLSLVASNWRSEQKLEDYLQNNNIVAITNIDTRKLTRIIRSEGSLRGWISSKPGLSKEELAEHAICQVKKVSKLKGVDLATEVSTATSYKWQQSIWNDIDNKYPEIPTQDLNYHVVVYDFGVKRNIMRMLVNRGCRLTVVPAKTTADEVLKLNPNGILLSNGPGDPEPCDYAIAAIKKLISKNIAILGICLGYQLLALAGGAKTVKMKFGHHGANHPVYDIKSKKVFISSQNHSFAVDKTSLPENIQATHVSLFDGSLQGIKLLNSKAFGFQGHPEASPGPQELDILFNQFIEMMKN